MGGNAYRTRTCRPTSDAPLPGRDSASQVELAAREVDTPRYPHQQCGIAFHDDLSNLDAIEQHLAVNLFETLRVTRAFLPLLRRSKGAIVNNLSLVAIAPLPLIAAYPISKAAASDMT